jgi:hypothetical protein
MSVLAGNALAVLKGNLRAVHGEEMVAELSTYAWVNDVAEVHAGMMIALPPAEWMFLEDCSAAQVAGLLNDLAVGVPIERMLRSRRGPKRPRKTRESPGCKIRHVATKKLLDACKGVPPLVPRNQIEVQSEVRDVSSLHVHGGSRGPPYEGRLEAYPQLHRAIASIVARERDRSCRAPSRSKIARARSR